MADSIKDVTDIDFKQKVLEASKQGPVLMDVWAPWCGPCKQMFPTVEKLAKDKAGQLTVVKMSLGGGNDGQGNPLPELNQKTAQAYQIESLPTVILFQNGREAGRLSGLQNRNTLERLLADHPFVAEQSRYKVDSPEYRAELLKWAATLTKTDILGAVEIERAFGSPNNPNRAYALQAFSSEDGKTLDPVKISKAAQSAGLRDINVEAFQKIVMPSSVEPKFESEKKTPPSDKKTAPAMSPEKRSGLNKYGAELLKMVDGSVNPDKQISPEEVRLALDPDNKKSPDGNLSNRNRMRIAFSDAGTEDSSVNQDLINKSAKEAGVTIAPDSMKTMVTTLNSTNAPDKAAARQGPKPMGP